MQPFRIQFEDDEMGFIVLADNEDDAFNKWWADRVEGGTDQLMQEAADNKGSTVRDLTEVLALPPAGGNSFYANRP